MGIFGKIMGAIFGTSAEAAPLPIGPSSSGASAQTAAATSATPAATIDVAAVLDKAVAKEGEKLEWRTSIVDLMKALDLDSSLAARKELAQELKYSGDMNDFGDHEYLVARTNDEEPRGQRRQVAGGRQVVAATTA